MDSPQAWAALIVAVATAVTAVIAATKAASTAFREAVDRRAAEVENERLAKEATVTVQELRAEVAEEKHERERLVRESERTWHMYQSALEDLRRCRETVERLRTGSPP